MKKQVLVIGLGQFGSALVKALVAKRVEVVAVDNDPKRVQYIASEVDQAMCFDATDEDALARLSPATRDVCICATGDQSKEAAIICTALLKQMGAKRVIARGNDDLHSRILRMVGADEVINPEWAYGERYANHVVHEHILEEMSLGTDLVVTEFKVPEVYVGKTLVELQLRRKYGIIVVAVRSGERGTIRIPDPEDTMSAGDILVVVAHEGVVPKLLSEEGDK
ncbi:MAG: TrkA family potassium uptake protein [Bdellovibrionales bacterium]|nr:TrkA family potassium uptake protein [Bdellovibrionales bacterium]